VYTPEGFAELAADWQIARGKAVNRRLNLRDYQGATFYLSNLGMFSVVQSFDAARFLQTFAEYLASPNRLTVKADV
jgi:pyruvate/2-oxoglutarate dehydrogenase complex dihydrolipoamide acyltransferase (E2) component